LRLHYGDSSPISGSSMPDGMATPQKN